MSETKPPGAKTAVVLLNWNSGEMTADCIRSLLRMSSPNFQIIVVDNGSHDGSAERMRREFKEITVLAQDRNLGFAAGCNAGMREALTRRAKYVLLLNNDTIVHPDLLTELEDAAKKHPRTAMVSPKIYFWDAPDRIWWAGGTFNLWTGIAKHVGRKYADEGQFDSNRALDWATGCAVLIRTDALQQCGLFDESFFGNAEDLDLSLRFRRVGYQVLYAPRAKLWHKEGVDYRKNAGEYVRKFTATRNLLFVMRKHASSAQWLTFFPNFVLRHVAFYVALSVLRRDFRSAWAVLEGVAAFLRAQIVSGTAPTLPPGISTPGRDPVLNVRSVTKKESADAGRN